MNYIRELNAFRVYLKTNSLEAITQALWYVIADYHNSSNWERWIVIDNQRLAAELCITEKTLIKHRNKLIQAGLLEYKSQQRKKSSGKYSLLRFELGEVGKPKTAVRTTEKFTADRLTDCETAVKNTADLTADRTADRLADRTADRTDLFKQNKTKQNIKNIYADFVKWYNEKFGTKCRADTYREKLKTRLEKFSIEQLKTAAVNMNADPYMTGQNDGGRVYATLEYLTRNDKNVDKWLVQKPKAGPQPRGDAAAGDEYEDVYVT